MNVDPEKLSEFRDSFRKRPAVALGSGGVLERDAGTASLSKHFVCS